MYTQQKDQQLHTRWILDFNGLINLSLVIDKSKNMAVFKNFKCKEKKLCKEKNAKIYND